MRHEYKRRINYEDYLAIRSRLRALASRDAHVGADGTYLVHSLYFDNLYDKALREKIDGVENREKFRIRYYNGDADYIRLEKKSKQHGLCEKQAAPLTKEEVCAICNGEIDFFRLKNNRLLQELYAKMRYQLLKPIVLVEYRREPYVYAPGNVRITFDSEIRTGLYHRRLFTETYATAPTECGAIIMEVKYDAFLPEIMEKAVRVPGRSSMAYSKYAACRMYG